MPDVVNALLRSRKVWVTIAGAVAVILVNALIRAVPALSDMQPDLTVAVTLALTVLFSVLVGSISYEDANKQVVWTGDVVEEVLSEDLPEVATVTKDLLTVLIQKELETLQKVATERVAETFPEE